MGKLVTQVYRCSCRCSVPSVFIVRGTAHDSNTDLPLQGIAVTLVGTTLNTTTNTSGNFFFNVPSSRRRFVAMASDAAGIYLDNYVVKTIPGSESYLTN